MSRRLHVDASVLEALHRHGVLVPLFRTVAAADPERRIDISTSLTAQHVTNAIPADLFPAAAEGRVYDPVAEAFTAWPIGDSGYLYSRHQLLGLDAAESFVERLIPERQADESVAWHLDDAHYSDTAVVPMPGLSVLAGGGDRVLDIGIIGRLAA